MICTPPAASGYRWVVQSLAVLALAALSGCVTPVVRSEIRHVDAAAADRLTGRWTAVVGADQAMPFRGEMMSTGVGAGYQMFYPAPNFAGFLAGVATHAALQSSANAAQAEAEREMADRVLKRFDRVLGQIRVHQAFSEAIDRLQVADRVSVSAFPSAHPSPYVEFRVLGTLAQSRRALMIDLMARLQADPSGTTPEFVHKVRVISDPVTASEENVYAYWLDDDGARLKRTVSSLISEAIALFLADAGQQFGADDARSVSVRYRFGAERRIERAQLLVDGCSRKVLRNLRGWIVSVPAPEKRQDALACPVDEPEIASVRPPT